MHRFDDALRLVARFSVQSVLRALIAITLLGACFVHRASDAFQCTTQEDCITGRMCKEGYCVIPNCPSDCTMCDEDAKTCLVECTSTDTCGSVNCPSGWTCTINCTGANACASIDCNSGSRCIVTCTGTDACETLDCDAACKCDLSCSAADACNPPSCPVIGNGANAVRCTADGQTGSLCDSAHAVGCTKC